MNFTAHKFQVKGQRDIGCDTTGHLADCRNGAILEIFENQKLILVAPQVLGLIQ